MEFEITASSAMRILGKKLCEYFTEINTRHVCVDEQG